MAQEKTMTKTEYALFILTDGMYHDTLAAWVHAECGRGPATKENQLVVAEVERVRKVWDAAGMPDADRVCAGRV